MGREPCCLAALATALVLLAWPAATRAQPYPELVSRSAASLGDADGLRGRVSNDGRYVVFASAASTFDPTDTNGLVDVYLKDRLSGSVTRISRAAGSGGPTLGGDSGHGFQFGEHALAMSEDGQVIAFLSDANNLVVGDNNGKRDAFVHHRSSGVTALVSLATPGPGLGNGDTVGVAISGDGKVVAFSSYASNLVPGDSNATLDLFVRVLDSARTERVSLNDDDTQMATAPSPDRGAREPSLSRDGRYVAFVSEVNLAASDCLGQCSETWVRDRTLGTTSQASLRSGEAGSAAGSTFNPYISADGRYVLWSSLAVMALPDNNVTNGSWNDVFLRDRLLGTTEHISQSSDGRVGHIGCGWPWISADGRFVAFHCNGRFGADDTLDGNDVYLRDRRLRQTLRVSVSQSQTQGNSVSSYPKLSADGRWLLFESAAGNLVPGDSNGRVDSFLLANPLLSDPASRLASSGQAAAEADRAELSADGRYLFFATDAGLLPGDDDGQLDIYRRDLANPDPSSNLLRVSRGSGDSEIAVDTADYAISADGERVVFLADPMFAQGKGVAAARKAGSLSTVLMRNLLTDSVQRVSPAAATVGGKPALSGDGRRVAFVSADNSLVTGDGNGMDDVFVTDVDSPEAPLRASVPPSGDANGASRAPALSFDGNVVVFESEASNLPTQAVSDGNAAADIVHRDLQAQRSILLSAGPTGTLTGASRAPQVSADGQRVVFESTAGGLVAGDANNASDVLLANAGNRALLRISSAPGGAAASGASSAPRISADGSSIGFRSAAENLLAGDSNGHEDIFVFEPGAPANKRRLARGEGGTQANGASTRPALSNDGQKVAFESLASNLSAVDFNGALSDVFVNGPLDPDRVFRNSFE